MNKIELIVTRHMGLLQYLYEIGLCTDNVKVVDRATPELIKGKHVCGVLPHSLSALTASFTEVPLSLPNELRGVELSYEQVKRYAGKPVTYVIKVIG